MEQTYQNDILLQPDTVGLVVGQILDGTYFVHMVGAEDQHTVVCVHGIGSFCGQYDDLASYLHGKGFSVLTYDLIGRGKSNYPDDERFDGDAHVQQLRNLVLNLKINVKRYHIIAHSMGGAIAALYAAQFPEEISSLCLLSPAGLMGSGIFRLLRCCSCLHKGVKNKLKAGQEEAWRSDFVLHQGKSLEIEDNFVQRVKTANEENPKMFEAFWQSVLQFPLWGIDESVERISACSHLSVFLMWGTEDTAVPYSPNFSRWQHLLESANGDNTAKHIDFAIYQNLGHGFLLEASEMVHEEIGNFLQKTLALCTKTEGGVQMIPNLAKKSADKLL